MDADDLLQITLMKACRSATLETAPVKIAFLMRIAKHAWIDECRRKAPIQVPLAEDRFAAGYYPAEFNVREAFETMADRLSARQMVLILLVDVFGFTMNETAIRIGSTEGAIKEATKRARLRLRRLTNTVESGDKRNWAPAKAERMTPELLDTFVQAFRSGNVRRIYEAYRDIRVCGAVVTNVWAQGATVCFEFRDPDGHTMQICSKAG